MGEGARSYLSMEARRTQLLELGLRLFGANHYDAVSIEQVALEAKVSKGLLYHYFGGKRDYYMAVVRFAAQQLLDSQKPAKDVPFQDNLRSGLKAYFEFVTVNKDTYLSVMHGGLGSDPAVQEVIEETRGVIVDDIFRGLEIEDVPSLLRTSVRAWLGAVEGSALDLLRADRLCGEALIQLITGSLVCHIMMANQILAGQTTDLDFEHLGGSSLG